MSDDKSLYARISDIVGIVRQPIESIVVIGSERFVISHAEHIRLITSIEAENADSIAVKEKMFHYDGGQSAFPLTSVRSWATYPESGERRKIAVVNLFDMPSANLFDDDIPRFLAAMGVPNEPT